MITLYHNPRCRKSRETLELIQEKGESLEIKLYLKEPPTAKELKEVLAKLGLRPLELIRKQEAIFKEKFKGKEFADDQWIDVMVVHPILIERPIAIKGNTALIGRPPSKVQELM